MNMFECVTHEMLEQAVLNKLEVTDEIAHDIASRVLNYFGYEDEVIDNRLNQDDRRLFYFLQDVHLISTFWEEELLPTTGRMWRVFYWRLNKDQIEKAGEPVAIHDVEAPGLYENLPEDIWCREGSLGA
jgi:hypothetical protein